MKAAVAKERVNVSSIENLASELKALRTCLALPETEHTWERIDAGLKRFTAAVRGGACKFEEEFVRALKEQELAKRLLACIGSERTRLSGTAFDLIAATTRLGHAFAPLLPIFAPHIVRLCGRTNKLYIQRAQACLSSIVVNTRLAAIMPFLREAMDDKASQMRKVAIETVLAALEGEHMVIEKVELDRRYLGDLETVIRKGAVDREPGVRQSARSIWQVYRTQWPERVEPFSASLDSTVRKQFGLEAIKERPPPLKFVRPVQASSATSLTQSVGPAANPSRTVAATVLSHSVASSQPAAYSRSASARSTPAAADDLFAPALVPLATAKTNVEVRKAETASDTDKVPTLKAEAPVQIDAAPIIPSEHAGAPSLPSVLVAAGARAPSRTFKPALNIGRGAPDRALPTFKPGRAVTAPTSMAATIMPPPPTRPALPYSHSASAENSIKPPMASPLTAVEGPHSELHATQAAPVGPSSGPASRQDQSRPQSRSESRSQSRQEASMSLATSRTQYFKPVRPGAAHHARSASAQSNEALSKSTSTSSIQSGMTRSTSFNKATAASIAKQADAQRIRKEREAAKEAAAKGKKALPPHLAGALLMRKAATKVPIIEEVKRVEPAEQTIEAELPAQEAQPDDKPSMPLVEAEIVVVPTHLAPIDVKDAESEDAEVAELLSPAKKAMVPPASDIVAETTQEVVVQDDDPPFAEPQHDRSIALASEEAALQVTADASELTDRETRNESVAEVPIGVLAAKVPIDAEGSLPSPFIKPLLTPAEVSDKPAPAESKDIAAASVINGARSIHSEERPSEDSNVSSMDLTASPSGSLLALAATQVPAAHFVPASRTIIRSPPFASLPTPTMAATAAFMPFTSSIGAPKGLITFENAVARPSLPDTDFGADCSMIASQEMPASGVLSPSPARVYAGARKVEDVLTSTRIREPLSPLMNS